MAIQRWQNRWTCVKCGRMFTLKQIDLPRPTCFFCGPDQPLQPWMESPNWAFLLFGFVGLPIIGHVLASGAATLGFPSVAIKQVCFFLIPVLLLVIDVPAYLTGRSAGKRMLRRGGEQGLLQVLGFLLSVGVLIATGHYASAVGIGR